VEVSERVWDERRPAGTRPSLLKVLVDAGVAAEEELRLAFAEGMGSGERFGEVVLRRGWLDEEGLARALARQWALPYLDDPQIDQHATTLLSSAAAAELKVCPVSSADDGFLVAVAEPSEERFAAVRAASTAEPRFALVTSTTLECLLERASEAAKAEASAAAASRAARVAADEQSEASLQWLDSELVAAGAQLSRLRERVVQLVDADQRRMRELADCRAEIARLSRSRVADEERIRTLESQVARQQERLVAVRAKLTEASNALDA
jgi:hypothetical protein